MFQKGLLVIQIESKKTGKIKSLFHFLLHK